MVDTSNLTEKLDNLTGLDFEEVEKDERIAGNNSVDVTFSKSFQARLAARALNCNPYEIKELPLKKYNKVVTEVMSFLFAPSEKEETRLNGSETRQST